MDSSTGDITELLQYLRHTLSHVVHEESGDAMRYTQTITNPKEIIYVASSSAKL